MIGYYINNQHEIKMLASIDGSIDDFKEIYHYKINDKWHDVFTLTGKFNIFTPISFLKNDIAIVLSNVNWDKNVVVEYDLINKRFGKILYRSEYYDIMDAEVNEVTGELKSVSYIEKGVYITKHLDAEIKQYFEKLEKALADTNLYMVDYSIDKQHIILLAVNSHKAGTYYYHYMGSREVMPLFVAYPNLEKYNLTKTINIKATNSDGKLLEAYLTEPLEYENNYPLIVYVHGGPIATRDINSYNPEIQFLTNRGYGVLRVNYRGSRGYGKEFIKSGIKQWGKGIEDDINLVVDQVIESFSINRAKMCIIGASYGGYSSLMSVIRFPEKYQCAATIFGVTDIPLMLTSANYHRYKPIKDSIEYSVGNIEENIDEYINLSPVYRSEDINVPVMIMVGMQDRTVFAEHGHRLHTILDLLDKENDFVVYPNSGHGHYQWSGDQHQAIQLLAFLDKSLSIEHKLNADDQQLFAKELANIASEYYKEKIVNRNVALAKSLFEYSALLGSMNAVFTLGYIYENSIDENKDIYQALKMYQQACDGKLDFACIKLGETYKKGLLDKEKNINKAIYYYEKAIDIDGKSSNKAKWQLALLLSMNKQMSRANELLLELAKFENKYQDKAQLKLNSLKTKGK